jgi:hypothetical protein
MKTYAVRPAQIKLSNSKQIGVFLGGGACLLTKKLTLPGQDKRSCQAYGVELHMGRFLLMPFGNLHAGAIAELVC